MQKHSNKQIIQANTFQRIHILVGNNFMKQIKSPNSPMLTGVQIYYMTSVINLLPLKKKKSRSKVAWIINFLTQIPHLLRKILYAKYKMGYLLKNIVRANISVSSSVTNNTVFNCHVNNTV